MEAIAAMQIQSAPVVIPAQLPAVQIDETIKETTITKVVSLLMPGETFKDLFGPINAIHTEAILNINPDGISCRVVDNANVAMVSIDFKKDVFDIYKVTEPVKLGVDISTAYSLKTMIKKGSMVSFEVNKRIDPATKDKEEKTEYTYSISIEGTTTRYKALDLNTMRKQPNVPTVDLKTTIDLSASEFIQGIKDGSKVSDKVALVFDDVRFSMVFEGNTTTMNKEVCILKGYGEKTRSLFSMDYLKDMIKILNKKEIIRLSIRTDFPMKITRGGALMETVFLLAPRIEAD
jgi:proliferating cell nuclear antigen